LPGAFPQKVIQAKKLHRMLKATLRYFSPFQIQKLSRLWMPVAKNIIILGGKLHGCELAEFLVKRGRKVAIVHSGPASELGSGITKDDLENLWPWFKQKHVSLWSDAMYREVVEEGLKIQVPDKRVFVIEGKHILPAENLSPNKQLIEELAGLANSVYLVDSCKEPGLLVDAVRDGALVGYSI
jgi:2,4-dienoyl-CoA reductase (NADPH2)